MIPRPDIDGNQCPICGFAQSMDGWLEIVEQQHLMQRLINVNVGA